MIGMLINPSVDVAVGANEDEMELRALIVR